MKKITISIAVFSLLALVALPVIAADEGTVSATVTAQIVSVAVTDGNVSYGVLGLGTTKDTTATGVNETQTATNNGNVSVDLKIRSSDATSAGTPWNLAGTAASDAFTHEFSINSGSSWTDFDTDNNVNVTLANGVAALGTQDFDLRIGTPTASTDQLEHTITVTVLATAS